MLAPLLEPSCPRPGKEAALARLEARIRAIEGGGWAARRVPAEPPAVPDAVPVRSSRAAPDGGRCELPDLVLARGVVHEWFGLLGTEPWIPPLGVLMQLALGSLREAPGVVLWIGRRLWPYLVPGGRDGDADLLERSVFVDPPDEGSRLWAIDLAARSQAVATVIADGSGLDLAQTRRLQLAAESGGSGGSGGALVHVARPPQERERLSAAAARWLVRVAPARDRTPRWIVELSRCKGMRLNESRDVQSSEEATVEWKRVEGGLAVPAALCKRSCAPDLAARRTA